MPSYVPDKAWYFIFSGNDILVRKEKEGGFSIPCLDRSEMENSGFENFIFLGTYDNLTCYSGRVTALPAGDDFEFINLRAAYGKFDSDMFWTAGYARQIADWNINFQFCGRCGALTERSDKEYHRKCQECGLASYPRISPAILAAVVKDDQILLARGVNFPNKKMFSVLAGFVEPGESLESCVTREVYEETGIQVSDIRYFGSQPWPFPDSLMIGFTAKYDGGDIRVDPEEIAEAQWFNADDLPLVPGKPSLSGELIQWFVNFQ